MRAAAPGAAGAAAPPPADAAPDGADSLTAAKDPKYDRRWAAFGQYGERLGPLFDRAVARKHILKRLRGILKSLPRGTAMGAKGTIPLTAASISRVLIAVGHNESDVAKWLTPKDDQSMHEAVALLKAIVGLKLEALPAADLELRSQMQDLILWGEIYEGRF